MLACVCLFVHVRACACMCVRVLSFHNTHTHTEQKIRNPLCLPLPFPVPFYTFCCVLQHIPKCNSKSNSSNNNNNGQNAYAAHMFSNPTPSLSTPPLRKLVGVAEASRPTVLPPLPHQLVLSFSLLSLLLSLSTHTWPGNRDDDST